jgi:competence protein ComEC
MLWDGSGYALMVALGLALLVGARSLAVPRLLTLSLRGTVGLRTGARAALVLLTFAVLAFGLCGLRAARFSAQALDPALEGRDVVVTGVVAAMPQRNETGVRFRRRKACRGAAVRIPPQLYLCWYGGATPDPDGMLELQRQAPELHAGERWQMTLRLKAPHGNSNPHGFDYELWLWEQGLQATGYVRAGPRDTPPERVAETWRHPVERARQDVRDAVFRHVADRKTAGLLAALVVGDQNAIERADWDVFRAQVWPTDEHFGLHHHVRVGRRAAGGCAGGAAECPAAGAAAALVGGMLLAAGYALFSGWGVPAQRTVWMLAAVCLLRLSARRWPWPQVWLLACAVVVTLDPWALLQPGFWLSFVAVGVLFATDPGVPARASGPVVNTAGSMGTNLRTGAIRASSKVVASLREQWVIMA